MLWVQLDPRAHPDHLGFIPSFLSEHDPRPAAEQFRENYIGGWTSFKGFKLLPNGTLKYPGDPFIPPLFKSQLRDETITVYAHAWVMITQADGTWEVARLD